MKLSLKSHLSTAAVIVCLGAFGCGKAEDIKREESFKQLQLEPGTYRSERCFKNKVNPGTQYATADVTFNGDGTGSAQYQLFSDAGCTVRTGDQALTFSEVAITPIGGVNVIRVKQNAPVVDPVWWVPAALSDGGYSLDVDHTDGESGPYFLEPSEADLASFRANAGQGVAFKKL